MQQAIDSTLSTPTRKTIPSRSTTARRHLALKWDLYGVLTLLVSSAAYGAFALAHAA